MERKQWLWWKPLLVLAVGSFVAALVVFEGDIPHEIVVVLFVVALVAASRLLRGP